MSVNFTYTSSHLHPCQEPERQYTETIARLYMALKPQLHRTYNSDP